MTPTVRPAANGDVTEALSWQVRRKRYSAATGIWIEWLRGQAAIEAMPQMHPPAEDAPPGREVRNYLTRKYGYRIVYEMTPTEITILAFVRARRRPGAWLDRLTPGDSP